MRENDTCRHIPEEEEERGRERERERERDSVESRWDRA